MRMIALLLLTASVLHPQRPVDAQQIFGRALDLNTRRPVPAVYVKLMDGDTVIGTATADSTGAFTLSAPRAGRYRVATSLIGYSEGLTEHFEVPPARNIRIDVPMRTAAIELSPIAVNATRNLYLESKGFYERTRVGKGAFLTSEQIERRVPSSLTETLRSMSGLRTQRLDSREEIMFSGAKCYPQVVLDGVTVRWGGTTGKLSTGLDDLVNVWHIEAIEAYRGAGDIPIEYEGPHSACGVILIWTRHR